MHIYLLIAAALVVLAAVPAHADVVWPALYLENRLLSWWAIALGLLIEFFFIQRIFALSAARALVADVAANAASSAFGIALIPLAGIGWELFPGWMFNEAFGWGTFNPVTWTVTFFLASLLNAALESAVLLWGFKLVITKVRFLWLTLANMLSVGVAWASISWFPVHL